MSRTVVLVAHGSRDPRFADTARRVGAAVAQRLPDAAVRVAFLDLNSPSVGDALAAAGDDPVVVPLLLAPGYHSTTDLPALLADAGVPAETCSDVVGSRSLTTALADRLRQAGLRPGDGVVLTAVGSTDPDAESLVRRRADQLAQRLSRPVEVVFATRLGTDDAALRTALARLAEAGATGVAVSPYFLSAGLLTERVEGALDRLAPGSVVAGPIGTHPHLVDAVVRCVRSVQVSSSAATLVARA